MGASIVRHGSITPAIRALAILLGLCIAMVQTSQAGDRAAVTEALRVLEPNWPDAQFSVDVTGITNGEVLAGQPLGLQFEAAARGHVSYIHMTSHGNVTLTRTETGPQTSGTRSYVPGPTLGSEQLIVMFSSQPLDTLFANGSNSIQVGSDRKSAEAFVQRINQLKASGNRISMRKYRFAVSAQQGGTEYTTRGIVFQVQSAKQQTKNSTVAATLPSRLEFEFDSDRLTERGKRDLDAFGEALATNLSDARVTLVGHTDSMGTDQYNIALSQRRADAAKSYLVESFGIDRSAIDTKGMGKAAPVASNESEAERVRNRRVDFVFSVPK